MSSEANCEADVIYVDLDGTLSPLDSLHASLAFMVRQKPSALIQLPLWLGGGKAHFKAKVANAVDLPMEHWPIRSDLLQWLLHLKTQGKRLVLATAAHISIAQRLNDQLNLFDAVLASREVNLSGTKKCDAICADAQGAKFLYVGDAQVDWPIWQAAHEIGVVQPSSSLLSRLKGLGKPVYSFDRSIGFMSSLIRLIRPHQWVKNLLLFVPLFAAHRLNEPNLIWGCLACFFAQSLIASAGYILNDLLDAHADRAHPIKRNRPLAAGSFPVPQAMFLMLFCLILGFVLAGLTPSPPYLYLCLYFLLSLSYSLYFKRKLMIDVMVLAGLYTLRIIMGGEATGILVSPWLLAFSMFLFLSLAFLKRAGELLLWTENKVLPNRAYQREDLDIVLNLGPSSGMMAVLVFALYVSNEETHRLYHRQEWLWLVCPLLIYWIARMWFKARRGEIPSDPVLFALKDPASLLCGLSVLACMWLAI